METTHDDLGIGQAPLRMRAVTVRTIVAGTPIRTFKWDSASSNYSEYGGTTLQTINDATSVSINQNGDELVIGRNSVSQIFILTNGVWSRRATVSGTSGEGKSVRVANDGKGIHDRERH